jgi:cell division protein FtsL
MKNKVTFFIISSKTGKQRRFSINKKILYCMIISAVLLMCSGVIGAWKYRENIAIRKECLQLEAKKGQLETIARTVRDIKTDETHIGELLGLENIKQKGKTP